MKSPPQTPSSFPSEADFFEALDLAIILREKRPVRWAFAKCYKLPGYLPKPEEYVWALELTSRLAQSALAGQTLSL